MDGYSETLRRQSLAYLAPDKEDFLDKFHDGMSIQEYGSMLNKAVIRQAR